MPDNFHNSVHRRAVLKTVAGTLALPFLEPAGGAESAAGWRLGRRQNFDADWRFLRGSGDAFSAASFDDGAWRVVDLPHDWSIEDLPPGPGIVGPFDPKSIGGTATGFTVGGEGWYRKHLTGDGLPAGAHVEILFEAAYHECDVWLNGQKLGTHVFGYTPFAFDLTGHIQPGDNVIAVRVRDLGRNSRWYAGSGLYRGVTLDVLPEPARVERWGVGLETTRLEDGAAEIVVQTRLAGAAPDLILVNRIRDSAGTVVAQASSPASALVRQVMTVVAARLWSPEEPTLYRVETELCRGPRAIDQLTTNFGIRIVSFDAVRGMLLNGAPVKLRGGCVHQDNGLLGAAAFADAEDRRVRLLKARGFNALRCSHNPPSQAFLDACDRHGMMLIDEAFDTWFAPKLPQDNSTHFLADWEAVLSTMIATGRNHPSVVIWSIGNEVPQRSSPRGIEMSWRLANKVHELDPTRPVAAAINAFAGRPMIADADTARAGFAGVADESADLFLDLVGYNYKLSHYAPDHARYPRRVMFGSESFPSELFDVWAFAEAHPYMVGDFVWAAMDYLGEAGVGNVVRTHTRGGLPTTAAWPWVVSNCGDLDLTGRQKPQSLARDVAWRLSPIEIAVLRPLPAGTHEMPSQWGWSDEVQSWSWPGCEGQAMAVRVYSRAERIELWLNGAPIVEASLNGAETLPIEFQVPYAPGQLEVVAFKGTLEIGRRILVTTGAAAAIRLLPEQDAVSVDSGRLAYIGLEVTDARGRWVPGATEKIRLTISGPARLAGFGSASPFAQAGFQSPVAETFDGRALAIVKTLGTAGTIRIVAEGTGLRPGTAAIQARRRNETSVKADHPGT